MCQHELTMLVYFTINIENKSRKMIILANLIAITLAIVVMAAVVNSEIHSRVTVRDLRIPSHSYDVV